MVLGAACDLCRLTINEYLYVMSYCGVCVCVCVYVCVCVRVYVRPKKEVERHGQERSKGGGD